MLIFLYVFLNIPAYLFVCMPHKIYQISCHFQLTGFDRCIDRFILFYVKNMSERLTFWQKIELTAMNAMIL